MSDNYPDIPSIVTTGPILVIDEHPSELELAASSPSSTLQTRSPTTQALLSPSYNLSPGPSSQRHVSLEVPPSPTPTFGSSNDGSTTLIVPPSPTLSHASSVHFATSLSLRDNDVNKLQSSGLLSPTDTIRTQRHGRNRSWGSSIEGHSIDGTEPDQSQDIQMNPLQQVKTASSDNTRVNRSRSHSRVKSRSRESNTATVDIKGKEKDSSNLPDHLRSQQIDDIDSDPGPFAFKPRRLAQMLDPKDLKSIGALGGIDAILLGLGTDPKRGIGNRSFPGDHGNEQPGAGLGVSQRHRRPGNTDQQPDLPGIVVTAPEGSKEEPDDVDSPPPAKGSAFSASLEERRRVYGPNILPQRSSKSLWALMLAALKDKVLILLSIAAVVSLALGLFQDFGPGKTPGQPPVDWVEGVAIMVAILIVVVVGSLNDWQKERQFRVLNQKKDERGVKVIRGGIEHIIDVKEVVVGDIALLEPGEVIPCDGIFLSGYNVRCDESDATGESDTIKKAPYDECCALVEKVHEANSERALGRNEHNVLDDPEAHADCFLLSGSRVLEGVGKYVVVAVGTKSFNGRIMMALRGDAENTPLQMKLNHLAELIAKLGSAAGLILFTALMIRFIVQVAKNDPVRTANQKGIAFVNILIISVTLIVVAVPEGLPLAVTLALAFATKCMTYEKLLVRVLTSCETMANASVVCTDKTGTLTQNEMTIVAGSIGIHAKFVRGLEFNSSRSNAEEEETIDSPKPNVIRKHPNDFSLDETEINAVLSPQLRDLLNATIAVNSTVFKDVDAAGKPIFIGSRTEAALLQFTERLGWDDYKKVRNEAEVVQVIPFSSERKAMGVVVRLKHGKWRLYLKGASEILSKSCIRHVVVHKDGGGALTGSDVETAYIGELDRDNISRTIIFYANQALRTIALCYRDLDSWPLKRGVRSSMDNEVAYEDLACNLTLIGIVGIEDPLRDGVREAVANCHRAGVTVKMCTGDNVLTARSIALQSGIFTAGGIITEGPVFRNFSDHDMLEIVPRLQVLARSSPEDKKLLVEKLKELGETVGVTGDGTNDGPALKTAHVGFSMGLTGTEVAKEASDIILMDDNFSSIVKAIMWGRCVNDAVRKFLQFQVTVNVAAVVITLVSSVVSTQETPVLSAVQLLWVNIIMDTFAALALATDRASESLLDRNPEKRTAPLFSVDMYKQILFQSVYQIAITLLIFFIGDEVLGHPGRTTVQTLAFNTFVFAQISNSFNCRRLDRKLNIFEGITRNWNFIGITVIEIMVQVLIVNVGRSAFQVTRIDGGDWGIALALGVVSIPLGAIVRLLPNRPFEVVFRKLRLLSEPNVLPLARTDVEWNSAITQVRDNLGLFAQIRSGRLRSASLPNKNRLASDTPFKGQRPRLPSLMAMVPSLIASSIGAGWAPQSGSLSDPAHFDPSKSSAALWDGKILFHPDTPSDDPLYLRWARTPSPFPSAAP